jgi:acyl-coenzyme A thioesterase PaaI-like protein
LDSRPGGEVDDAALRRQRQAIDELGEALRDLVQHASATEAPVDELLKVAAQIRDATVPLAQHPRGREQVPSADDLLAGVRMYNPVTGTGSGLAPPLRIELVDGVVVGTCTLGPAFEGPPMYAHGGVSALLMDQMLGYATSASGRPGLTVALVNRYRAPVPLQTPLRLTARVTAMEGRKVTAEGIIATAAAPDTALVEATGTFVALRPEQSHQLFGAALHPDATDPAVAHD